MFYVTSVPLQKESEILEKLTPEKMENQLKHLNILWTEEALDAENCPELETYFKGSPERGSHLRPL